MTVYNPESQLEDYYIPASTFKQRGSKVDTLERESWGELPDLEYFQKIIERSSSPEAAAKYQKQIELLEDSIVIYHVGTRARPLHALPSFPFEHARARNFLKKLLDR